MVHSGYHLLDSVWVQSGYHPLKHRLLRIVFGSCFDITLLNIVLLR